MIVNEKQVTVSLRNSKMVLVFREPSPDEFLQILKTFKEINFEKLGENNSLDGPVDFIDELLVDVIGISDNGQKIPLNYRDRATGAKKPLTNQVSNWKKEIPFWCKYAAVGKILDTSAKAEDDQVKN